MGVFISHCTLQICLRRVSSSNSKTVHKTGQLHIHEFNTETISKTPLTLGIPWLPILPLPYTFAMSRRHSMLHNIATHVLSSPRNPLFFNSSQRSSKLHHSRPCKLMKGSWTYSIRRQTEHCYCSPKAGFLEGSRDLLLKLFSQVSFSLR